MRLTCPNCGARYEVDEAMIPPEGRDVQCSNCTTTWFQPGLEQGLAELASAPPAPEPPSEAHREPTRPIPVDEAEAAPRRELDPEVRDVLREEAARESELRRREGTLPEHQDEMPLETAQQPYHDDFGDADDDVSAAISGLITNSDEIGELQDAPGERARSEAAARYDDVQAAADDVVEAQIAAAAAAGNGSRRDLLPDIEEINSTLRATESRGAGDPAATDINTVVERPQRRSGARLGFALAILIFAALIAVYVNAPRIIAAVPATEPVLNAYVEQVGRLRLWIDDIAQGALTSEEPVVVTTPEAEDVPIAAEPVTEAEEAVTQAEDSAADVVAEEVETGPVDDTEIETDGATTEPADN